MCMSGGVGEHHPFEMKGMSQLEKAFARSSMVKRMVKERLRESRALPRAVLLPSGLTRLELHCASMMVQVKLCTK